MKTKMISHLGLTAITCSFLFLAGCASSVDETSQLSSGNWAGDDALSANRAAPTTTTDVRANDDPPGGSNAVTIVTWTQPTKGAVAYNSDGTFTYTPSAGNDPGADSFTYTAMDSKGNSSTATVAVTVASGWASPSVQSAKYQTSNYQKVVDANDNVTLIWAEFDSTATRYNLWANHYTNTTHTWGTPQAIDNEDANVTQTFVPKAVVDSSGNVTVVYHQWDGTRYNLWANRMAAGGTWGTAQKIETEDANTTQTFGQQLLVDTSGNISVTWIQYDGTRYNLWANRMAAVGTWGTAAKIDTEDLGSVTAPQLVMDGSGNVTAVWYQTDATRYNMWANRMSAAGTWGTATKIETEDLGDAFSPQVLVDGSGNATAIWYQYNGAVYNLWANRMASGMNFNGTPVAATLVDSENLGSVSYPTVAIDTSGRIVAVWNQYDGTRYNMWANRMSATGVWGVAAKIETEDLGEASGQQVIVDGSGNVTAVWYQYDGTRYNLWANRMSAAGAWGAAAKIETEDFGDATSQQLFVDSSGNVSVVWYQYDGTRYNLWANRWSTSTSLWGTATKIETNDNGDAGTPVLVQDSSGNLTAVWRQYDATATYPHYNLWANRMTSAGVWGTAVNIESEDLGDAQTAKVVVDDSGNVTVVWAQYDNQMYNLWSARYVSNTWEAATKLYVDVAGGNSSTLDLSVDSGGIPFLIARTYNGVTYTLWASDLR